MKGVISRAAVLIAALAACRCVFAETMPPLPEGAFTYAVIPDTQSYDGEGRNTKRGRRPGVGPVTNVKLDAIVDWLAANAEKENILFVTHTGDITDMNNEPQWRFASNAMSRLDGKVPYSVVPGNHDMRSNGDTSLFQRHFPASRYETNEWYAATFPGFTNSAGLFVSGNNANSICLFGHGKDRFVVVNLECNAPDPVLVWAERELAKYADRHVIVATHQDLGAIKSKDARTLMNATRGMSNEERAKYRPDLSLYGRMEWYKCHGKDGNTGRQIWEKFTSKIGKAFLVVSGDQGMVQITRKDERGANGNIVYSLMQDTGGGYIRIFRFIPSERVVRCYTIDPRRGGAIVKSCGVWSESGWFNFTLPYPGTADACVSPEKAKDESVSAIPEDDPVARRKVDWQGVANARDLGGLPVRGEATVRMGRIYRSSGLNDNAHYRVPGTKKALPRTEWKGPGSNRITKKASKYVTETLGVKTDLDLRTDAETFGMKGSPLGDKVRWVNISSSEYEGIGTEKGRAAFTEDFRVFLDEANYPILFHCIAGADRTGSLATILNGLLGVDEDLLHRDWQFTWTGRSKPVKAPEQRWRRLMSVFRKYEGATLNERIEKYVLSCGFTAGDIAAFRRMMLVYDDEVVWRDTFDDSSSVTNWCCESGFSVRAGEGIDGTGALVWEESAVRPVPAKTEPEISEEDNVVRELPQDGRKICRRSMPVEPGYRYTVSVRLNGSITNNCGYVFFDWYAKDGKRRGHWVAKPTLWKDVGTKGWQTLCFSSQRMPADAFLADVYIEFYRTTLGVMRFDNFTVTRDKKRLVELMFSSAYRDEQSEGNVRFVAPYILAHGLKRNEVSGRFVFAGKDGKITVDADKMSDDCFEVSLDLERLAFGCNEVRAEILRNGEVLDFCTMMFNRPAAPLARKVRIDGRGMTCVDGKPFFPVGVFVHPKDSKLQYLDRMKGGPFNCVIECAPQADVLDRIHKTGLMAIPKSPHSSEGVRSRYSALKNHPALLAWYVIDEARPDRALIEIPLQKLRREVDPHHPTFAVLSQVENAAPLMGCYDIVALDPYPLSVNCNYITGGCDRQDLLDVALWPGLMKENCYGLPPVWQVPQAFSWGWLRNWGKPELDRFPTYDELRSMSWQSIAGGANGILWYAASMIFSRMEKFPEEGEKCWSDLVKVAAEINAKMPWLVSEEMAPEAVEHPKTVAVRTFRKGGKTAVLVANRTSKPVSGDVRLADGIVFSVTLPSYGIAWR